MSFLSLMSMSNDNRYSHNGQHPNAFGICSKLQLSNKILLLQGNSVYNHSQFWTVSKEIPKLKWVFLTCALRPHDKESKSKKFTLKKTILKF